MDRTQMLDSVRTRDKPWDIIVIGGGATGVGCAVDAASRGLDVLLLEQSDFGKGTSSRSTKLVHGGVRYLAQGNISLVREALKERGILLRNAPHVVHKQSFIVPCYSLWQKLYYGTGLKAYDLLAGKHSFGRSRILSAGETLDKLPGVKSDGLTGGVLYYDGQFDDTRLLIDMITTAHEHGAAVLNYARVSRIVKKENGAVRGVEFEDLETGSVTLANARAIINATGAFCDGIRKMSDAGAHGIVTYSQGIHLVFPPEFLPGDSALLIPKTGDGRVLFAIPWHGHTLVGTTDTPVDKAELEPKPHDVEIEFILETAGRYLARPPTRADILSVFAGIRPLVKSNFRKNTASLSRGHTIEIDASEMLTITGGKWTTYRRMAEDAVDQAVRHTGIDTGRSVTAELRINDSRDHADEVGDRLHPDLTVTRGGVIKAVRVAMARTVEDVLARRTRALFLDAHASTEIAPRVAEIMAEELGKGKDWIVREIERFNDVAQNYTVP